MGGMTSPTKTETIATLALAFVAGLDWAALTAVVNAASAVN